MFANLKTILELIRLILSTWKWAKGQLSDMEYDKEIKRINEQVEIYKSGSREARLKALEELGK